MIVRGIDGNNDWMFGKGKNDYKVDKNAVAQKIETKTLSFIGDCFFAMEEGIDWFTFMGGKDFLQLKLSISAVILNIEEVLKMVEISIARDNNRTMTITYEVNTIYGVVNDAFVQEV